MKISTFFLGVLAILSISWFADGTGCQVVYRAPVNHAYNYNQHAVSYGHGYSYAVATQYVPVPIVYPSLTVGYGENYGIKKELEELRSQVANMNRNPVIVISGQGGVTTPQIHPQALPAPEKQQLPKSQHVSAIGGLTKSACGSCHSGNKAEGGFSIDRLNAASIGKAIELVIKGEMPPKDKGGPFAPEKNGDFIQEMTSVLKKLN